MSLPVNVDLIPEEMKALKNWVLWKYADRKNNSGEIKKTKEPYQINGKRAESDNPETWGSFENIVKTLERFPERYDGIGFVFSQDSGLMGLDFDHVKDSESGEWDPEACKEIESLNSYTEISPSGEGVHVIVKGEVPLSPDEINKGKTGKKNQVIGREMYHSRRFFTITGEWMGGAAESINPAQGAVNALYYKWFNERDNKKNAGKKEQTENKIQLSDSEIINIASRAKNSEKFKTLYNGNISGYGSQSEAEQAFCSLLAFYTQDPEQIDSIVRNSGLYRDKWDRADYREETINKALDGITATYNPEKKGKSGKGKPEKILVHFDEVGNRILDDNHIFSMRDNGQIYLYKDGVYRSEGTEAILGTQIREVYCFMYMDRWKEVNSDFDLPDHIPKATAKYVNEVLEYIRAYTHKSRIDIDCHQDRYINFKNGLFDLEKWELIEHDPEILSIAQIQARYDPEAKCPVITQYFKDCELTEQSINVLEEFSGYCLTTDVKLQKAVMLYGNGSNGKSVFINLLKTVLGKDFVSGESLQNLETDKYRVANLYGKRLNAFPDLKDSPLQTNEVFNTLTGNDLELTGERKYQHAFNFKPTVKLLFSANKIPFAYSDNYAYYRRWILIEFPRTFEKDEINERLLEELTTEDEKSGFINLMLEGLKRLLQNRKFSYDLGVDEIEKQYILHSDNVTVFEEQCLRDCSGNEEPTEKSLVYNFYVAWCKENNILPVKPKTFTKKLDKIGRKVHNTTKYNIDTKKGEWRSCYFNTIVDFKKFEKA